MRLSSRQVRRTILPASGRQLFSSTATTSRTCVGSICRTAAPTIETIGYESSSKCVATRPLEALLPRKFSSSTWKE